MVNPTWSQNPDRTQPFSEHKFGQTLCSLPPWSNSSSPLRPPSSWRERSHSSTRLHPSSHDASPWRSSARRCAAAAPRSVVSWGSPRSSGFPLEGPEEGDGEIAGLVQFSDVTPVCWRWICPVQNILYILLPTQRRFYCVDFRFSL